MVQEYVIPRPDDGHFHFRLEDLLDLMVWLVTKHFGRVVGMPNPLLPHGGPVMYAEDVEWYLEQIWKAVSKLPHGHCNPEFQPLLALYLTYKTTPNIIEAAFRAGARLIKVYPRDATTNSQFGILYEDIRSFYPCFEKAASLGMPIANHFEDPSAPDGYEEQACIPILKQLYSDFPGAKISVEHISSGLMLEAVFEAPPCVGASATVHHPFTTRKEVDKDYHLKCRPMPKELEDTIAIQQGILSGSPKLWFGSDCAAHKESVRIKRHGVCNIEAALPRLAEFFENNDALHLMGNYTSGYFADFFGLPRNKGAVTLRKEECVMPEKYPVGNDSVVPFMAGQYLAWKVV